MANEMNDKIGVQLRVNTENKAQNPKLVKLPNSAIQKYLEIIRNCQYLIIFNLKG